MILQVFEKLFHSAFLVSLNKVLFRINIVIWIACIMIVAFFKRILGKQFEGSTKNIFFIKDSKLLGLRSFTSSFLSNRFELLQLNDIEMNLFLVFSVFLSFWRWAIFFLVFSNFNFSINDCLQTQWLFK